MASGTTILGLPIPSSSPIFVTLVVIHILFGIAVMLSGLMAMLSQKGRGRHSTFGKAYFWLLAGVGVTMAALSTMRWSEDYPLFILGVLALTCAYTGRRLRRKPRLHLVSMGASYVLMLTAFYVDNGKVLPLWKELPSLAYWLLPGALGIPLIIWASFRHPIVVGHNGSRWHLNWERRAPTTYR